MNAVVLSGGGSAGAYQIGVWRALKKMNFKYDIACGTSVGAINASLMCEKNFHKAIKLWKNLDYNMIFDTSNIDNNKIISSYAKNILVNGGMDVSVLENNLKKYINVDKIYKSKINYGLVTVNISKRKTFKLQKKDIPKDKFLDYVMASATCFPAFQMKEINNDKYIDGGFSDNLPINLAISMGADNIIAVDLKKPGFKKSVKKDVNVTYIIPRVKTSNFLVFNEENAKIDIIHGYNDTLKTFGFLDGNIYTFKNNNLVKFINKNKKEYKNLLNKLIVNKIIIKNLLKILYVNSIDKISDMMISSIDYLGDAYKIDNTKIYKIKNFNKLILNKFTLDNDTNDTSNKIKLYKLLDGTKAICYMYNKIEECINNNNYDDLSKLVPLFPRQFISAIYLYIIKVC